MEKEYYEDALAMAESIVAVKDFSLDHAIGPGLLSKLREYLLLQQSVAICYQQMERYDESEQLHQYALAPFESQDDDDILLQSFYWIGALRGGQGRKAESEQYLRRAHIAFRYKHGIPQ